jgi:hypothetical protein
MPLHANTLSNQILSDHYKTKIYTYFNLRKEAYYIRTKFYGIGFEHYISNNTKISFNYKNGSLYLSDKGYMDVEFIVKGRKLPYKLYFNSQKAKNNSHVIDLDLEYYYNSFVIQGNFSLELMRADLDINKIGNQKGNYILGIESDNLFLGVKLSNNYSISGNLYLAPKFAVTFVTRTPKKILKNYQIEDITKEYSSLLSWMISPEIALGYDIAFPNTVLKINPEFGFSYKCYSEQKSINNSSSSDFNILNAPHSVFSINTNISVYIGTFYSYLEVTSLNNCDTLTVTARIGVNY